MIAANRPLHRTSQSRLLRVDVDGRLVHTRRCQLRNFIHSNDVVVANDAATLPASLRAIHVPTGAVIEVRLAGRSSLQSEDLVFSAVLFGAGDFRTRTEDRLPPPPLHSGDHLQVGGITAVVEALLDHPRLIRLRFDALPHRVWQTLAWHGRPIQYAHVEQPLALWDVWTSFAAAPVAYEPPSAGFALDWSTLNALRAQGTRFVTLTHAAGISSTGDPLLDQRLPFDEPYDIPPATALAIEQARREGGRVIAIGTTVVRALEHAARRDGSVAAGEGIADQRLGPRSSLRVVDTLLSGTHEAGTSHYELLRAFLTDETLRTVTHELDAQKYLTHEFGDSVLIDVDRQRARSGTLRTREPHRPEYRSSPRKQRLPDCVAC